VKQCYAFFADAKISPDFNSIKEYKRHGGYNQIRFLLVLFYCYFIKLQAYL
jgi:hypothetical protein